MCCLPKTVHEHALIRNLFHVHDEAHIFPVTWLLSPKQKSRLVGWEAQVPEGTMLSQGRNYPALQGDLRPEPAAVFLRCSCPVLQPASHPGKGAHPALQQEKQKAFPSARGAWAAQCALLKCAGCFPVARWGAGETSGFASKPNTELKINLRRQ